MTGNVEAADGRGPSSIEAMALGFLTAQLVSAQPEFYEDAKAQEKKPATSIFWPFLGHRFRLTIEEIVDPPREDTPDRKDARAAARAAIGDPTADAT